MKGYTIFLTLLMLVFTGQSWAAFPPEIVLNLQTAEGGFPEGVIFDEKNNRFYFAPLYAPDMRLYQYDIDSGVESVLYEYSDSTPPYRILLFSGGMMQPDSSMLWVCASSFDFFDPLVIPNAYLFGIDVKGDQPPVPGTHQVIDLGAGSFCNDLVVSSNGYIYATDHVRGMVYRADLATFTAAPIVVDARLASRYLVKRNFDQTDPLSVSMPGVNGIELIKNQILVVATTAPAALFRIDLSSGTPFMKEIGFKSQPQLLQGDGNPLRFSGPDGIALFENNTLLVAQNGAVQKLQFDSLYSSVTRIYDLGSPGFGLSDIVTVRDADGSYSAYALEGHIGALLFGNPHGPFRMIHIQP